MNNENTSQNYFSSFSKADNCEVTFLRLSPNCRNVITILIEKSVNVRFLNSYIKIISSEISQPFIEYVGEDVQIKPGEFQIIINPIQEG